MHQPAQLMCACLHLDENKSCWEQTDASRRFDVDPDKHLQCERYTVLELFLQSSNVAMDVCTQQHPPMEQCIRTDAAYAIYAI